MKKIEPLGPPPTTQESTFKISFHSEHNEARNSVPSGARQANYANFSPISVCVPSMERVPI